MKAQPSTTQKEVTQFYDQLVFPSRVSNPMYAQLIPTDLRGMVADFGCGQSLFYDRLKSHRPEPTFLDISMNALFTIDYGLKINADICALPIQSRVYDVIVCIGVIHHLPNMKPAFEEMSRVLKNKGLAIIGIYSSVSLQAKIRKFYDSLGKDWMKKVVFWVAELLILLKKWENSHPVSRIEINKRAKDLLQTPLVQYLPVDHYIQMAGEVNLKLIGRTRISSMTILKMVKI